MFVFSISFSDKPFGSELHKSDHFTPEEFWLSSLRTRTFSNMTTAALSHPRILTYKDVHAFNVTYLGPECVERKPCVCNLIPVSEKCKLALLLPIRLESAKCPESLALPRPPPPSHRQVLLPLNTLGTGVPKKQARGDGLLSHVGAGF